MQKERKMPESMSIIAYHGKKSVKREYLNRVRQHRAADQLVQSYGYWEGGKGCAVGCTIHGGNHAVYETELGIPERLAHLEDEIFEGLPTEAAELWPEKFLSAIHPGADLSLVWNRFALWLLTESDLLTITDCNSKAIEQVAALHRLTISGGAVSENKWRSAAESAASAAESAGTAAWSAYSAAWSAAWSAYSAHSAKSAGTAAWSAASAAESAAWLAVRSAWSVESKLAAWKKMADKLIELLQAAR